VTSSASRDTEFVPPSKRFRFSLPDSTQLGETPPGTRFWRRHRASTAAYVRVSGCSSPSSDFDAASTTVDKSLVPSSSSSPSCSWKQSCASWYCARSVAGWGPECYGLSDQRARAIEDATGGVFVPWVAAARRARDTAVFGRWDGPIPRYGAASQHPALAAPPGDRPRR